MHMTLPRPATKKKRLIFHRFFAFLSRFILASKNEYLLWHLRAAQKMAENWGQFWHTFPAEEKVRQNEHHDYFCQWCPFWALRPKLSCVCASRAVFTPSDSLFLSFVGGSDKILFLYTENFFSWNDKFWSGAGRTTLHRKPETNKKLQIQFRTLAPFMSNLFHISNDSLYLVNTLNSLLLVFWFFLKRWKDKLWIWCRRQ